MHLTLNHAYYINIYSCYSFPHAFNLQIIYHITTCIFNATIHFTIQFMRFKHMHKNPIYTHQCWLFHFDYSIHISDGFHLMNPALIIIRYCAYTFNNSVSHHDGCRLVHPDMWYHLNAIRHQDGCRVVHPTKWDISSMPYAIMTDADWCIPPSGTLDNFGVPS